MADYDMVLRNTTSVPIVAYAIRHESQSATGRDATCQSSLGFSGPRIGAGETSTIDVHLQRSGPTTPPVVDFVLLSNGTYFGAARCGILHDYVTRLAERRATLRAVTNLIRRDGVEKTTAWINAELERDVQPLLTPTKLK